jgi:hypothetical protein
MIQNPTESKPSKSEQPSDEGLSVQRLVVRLRRRGHALNAVSGYHFLAHLWLIGWPSNASLYAAAIAWITLPFVAASVWHASEKLHAVHQGEDTARRLREFLSHNAALCDGEKKGHEHE